MEYLSIPHYRGLKEKYNELLHGEGIYFTTDTHEIIANKASYGDKIAKWEIEDGVLTLTLSSGEIVEIDFPEATETSKGMMSKEDKKKLDDIVANGAEKLANSRTIWGQSFDGTANVSGDITLDGAIISGDTRLVDLGLPSGTLWMDRNIGASKPSDYGLYFAWGETEGYTADEVGSKKQFSWADYKYANGSLSKLTKYCNNSSYGNDGYTDSLVTLETTDDAVLQNVHKYSIPTKAQLQELLDNTTSEWTTQDGVNGRLFTSKTNGNSIFVPAAGSGYDGSLSSVGSGGGLWSSSLNEANLNCGWYWGFDSSNAHIYNSYRSVGHSVRGVATSAEGSKTINLPSASGTLALDNVATDTTDGLMSSSDKTKIDNIENTYLPLAGGTMNKDADITLVSDNNQAVLNSKGISISETTVTNDTTSATVTELDSNKLSLANGTATLEPAKLQLGVSGDSVAASFAPDKLTLSAGNFVFSNNDTDLSNVVAGISPSKVKVAGGTYELSAEKGLSINGNCQILPNGSIMKFGYGTIYLRNTGTDLYNNCCYITGNHSNYETNSLVLNAKNGNYGADVILALNTYTSGGCKGKIEVGNPIGTTYTGDELCFAGNSHTGYHGIGGLFLGYLGSVVYSVKGVRLDMGNYTNMIVRNRPNDSTAPKDWDDKSFYTIGPKDTSFTTEYDAVAPLVQDATDTSKWYIPNEYINADYLPLTGGTMTGNLTLKGNTVKTISSAETHTLQSIVTPEIIKVIQDDSLTLESNETTITATEVTTPKIVITGTSSDDILLGDGETTSLSSILKQITTNKNAIDEINNKLTWVTLE